MLFEFQIGELTSFTFGNCPKTLFPQNDLLKNEKKIFKVEVLFSNKFINKNSSYKYDHEILSKRIYNRWNEVIRHPVIPFDMEERRDKLSFAYKELDYFIKCHEAMKKKGVLY